jgi:hypothetical protein
LSRLHSPSASRRPLRGSPSGHGPARLYERPMRVGDARRVPALAGGCRTHCPERPGTSG